MKKLIVLIIVGRIVTINAQGVTNTISGHSDDDKFNVENDNGNPLLTVAL